MPVAQEPDTKSVAVQARCVRLPAKATEFPYPDPASFFLPRWKALGYNVS